MSTGPVVVIARWLTATELLGNVLELAAELRLRSLEEPGCLGYEIFQRVEEPGALLLLERYRDSDALESHRTSKHYRELVTRGILPMLAERQVEILRTTVIQ